LANLANQAGKSTLIFGAKGLIFLGALAGYPEIYFSPCQEKSTSNFLGP